MTAPPAQARFTTEDTEINSAPAQAGDNVGLFYCMASCETCSASC